MEIIVNNPKEVVTQEEVKEVVTKIKIIQFVDTFMKVEAIVTVNGGQFELITLWEGDDYIAAGQFSDVDIENRVLEILGLK